MDQQPAALPLALIVEDEALLALEIEDVCRAEGFACAHATTLAQVRALALDHLAVAVIDLRLHGRLQGQRIVRALRRRVCHLPVVVVTGYGREALQADLRGLGGPTERLEKPVPPAALAAAVEEVVMRGEHGEVTGHGRRADDEA